MAGYSERAWFYRQHQIPRFTPPSEQSEASAEKLSRWRRVETGLSVLHTRLRLLASRLDLARKALFVLF